MQILDITLTGRSTSVDLHTSHTHDSVTTKIQVKSSDGVRTLAQYNVHSHTQSTTRLSLRFSGSIQIFLRTPTGRRIPMEVESLETIGDLKDKIEENQGILYDDQRLTFGGRQLEDDDRTLADYNIQDDSIIELLRAEIPMEILIKTLKGNEFGVHVRLCDTVLSVKEKIQEIEDIAPDMQRIIFAGRQLEDERTLADYKIGQGSVLTVVIRLTGD